MARSTSLTTVIRRGARAFSVVMAGVWLLGLVAAFLHGALIEHVTCAAHGELIHATEHPGVTALLADRSGPALRDAGAGSAEDTHGHDHCVVMMSGRFRAPPSSSAVLDLATAVPALRLRVSEQRAVASAAPLLRCAPKTSPPVV